MTHILWEIAEYATFVQDNPGEALSAYRDTIGDLAGSLAGSVIGAVIVATLLWSVDNSGRRSAQLVDHEHDLTAERVELATRDALDDRDRL